MYLSEQDHNIPENDYAVNAKILHRNDLRERALAYSTVRHFTGGRVSPGVVISLW